jgi:uncharacterized membrane protein
MVSAERAVSRVLAWGGVLGLALMLTGSLGYAMRSDHFGQAESRLAQAHDHVAVPGAMRDGLRRWPVDPLAVGTLGVFVLVLTPVAGLAVAVPCLWRSGDTRYAVIAAIVLAAVLLSFLLGAHTA